MLADPSASVHAGAAPRVAGIVNVGFPGVQADTLLRSVPERSRQWTVTRKRPVVRPSTLSQGMRTRRGNTPRPTLKLLAKVLSYPRA